MQLFFHIKREENDKTAAREKNAEQLTFMSNYDRIIDVRNEWFCTRIQ
jgi:hypothetical protein